LWLAEQLLPDHLAFLDRFAKDIRENRRSRFTSAQQPKVMQDRMKQITGERLKLLGINPQDNAAMKVTGNR
jgi:hypothetical protein